VPLSRAGAARLRLTGDWGLSEDLAQEAFVRVWRGWGNIRDQQSAPAYLRSTVVNLARRSLRQRLQERRAWSGIGDPRSADPGTDIDLLRALARLPARKRACVVLRSGRGLPRPLSPAGAMVA
jgi:DNA-directed RNA polymerase specialized sigma24 family protein